MGTKYSSVASSGYNASPPADDGSTSESNKVRWSYIKSKLGDPIKTLAEAINSALVTALDHSARSVTSSDTAAAADNERVIEVKSASVQITLSDAATMAAGYMVTVANQSSGSCTVRLATATDTIDMVTNTTNTIQAYETRRYIVNAASNGYITASSETKGLVFIRSQSASASATVDFTSNINSTFDEYLITITDVVPATNGANLLVRVSQSGVFGSGGTSYAYTYFLNTDGGAGTPGGSASTSSMPIALNCSTESTRAVNGEVKFWKPSGTSHRKAFHASISYQPDTVAVGLMEVAGAFQNGVGAIDGVRFLFSSGNIASGTFTLYGVRKS